MQACGDCCFESCLAQSSTCISKQNEMILSRKNYPASSFAHWLFFYGEIYRNPRFFLVSTVVSAHSFPSTNSKNWNFWVIRGVLGHLQFLTSQLHVFHRSFSKIVHVMVAKLRNNLIPVLVLRIGPFGISADFYPLCCLLCGRRVQWLDGALNRRDDSAVGYQTFCLKLGWQLSRSGWEAVFGAVAGLHSRFPEAVSWGLGFSFNVPGHQVSCFFWCRSLYQILKPGKCLLGIDPSNVQNCSQKGCIIWISSFIAPFILVHAPALPRVAKVIL